MSVIKMTDYIKEIKKAAPACKKVGGDNDDAGVCNGDNGATALVGFYS